MKKCKLLSAFFAILLSISTITSLSSCHGRLPIDPFAIPGNFDENEEINIVFWAKNENNETQQNVYKKAVRDFEAIYPNISITIKLYSNYNDIYKDVITNLQTGTTPNVCITYPDHIATYMTSKNTIVPLDELIDDEKYGLGGSEIKFDAPTKDEMIPKFLEEGIIEGEHYAMPFVRSTEACYMNTDLFDKLLDMVGADVLGYDEIPEQLTWDFMWKVSEAAMALGKNEDGTFKLNGQNVLIPFIYKSTDNMMIQMLKQKGAEYSDDNGSVLIFNDTTTELLYEISDHAKTRAFSTFGISSYPGNYLNREQCIFAIDSTAGATWMGSDAPQIDVPESELRDFNMRVSAIPQFDTENPQMISQGPSVCIFNKENTQEVLASWIFVQYLLTNEVQITYSQTEGYAPVTQKALDSAEYQDYLSRAGDDNDLYYKAKIEATNILLNNLDNTFVTPVFNGSTSLRNAAGELIESACKSARRREEIDSGYISTLYSETATMYHLNEIYISGNGTKIDFSDIPNETMIFLSILAAAWVFIGGYYLYTFLKKHKKNE